MNLLLSQINTEVPILQQQASISPPRTSFRLTFNTAVDLLWPSSLRLMSCVKMVLLWRAFLYISAFHWHKHEKGMDDKRPCCSLETFPPGDSILILKSTVRRPPLSELANLEAWSGDVISPLAPLNSWTLPLRTRTVKRVNEPRLTHQESRRRTFSVASHEHLQPACPQERDPYSRPPHQQPSSPSCYGSGGAKHSRSDLTSQCSANFSQPNQLD